MNWKGILMMGLMQAPGIVSAIEGIGGSGASKRQEALAGVMLGMQSFQRIDPDDFERVFSNPRVQEAIALANDHIHFALKTVDTVSAGLPAPQPVPATPLVAPVEPVIREGTSTPSSVPSALTGGGAVSEGAVSESGTDSMVEV